MTTSTATRNDRSLLRFTPRLRPRVRLVCIPYAGGTSTLFADWPRALPRTLELCPLELPGRGLRIREPLMRGMAGVVTEGLAAIEPYLDTPVTRGPPLRAAISAFGGTDDATGSPLLIDGWRDETASRFTPRMLAGTLYFLDHARPALTQAIVEDFRV